MTEITREQEAAIARLAIDHPSVAVAPQGSGIVKVEAGGRRYLIDEDGNAAPEPVERAYMALPVDLLRRMLGDVRQQRREQGGEGLMADEQKGTEYVVLRDTGEFYGTEDHPALIVAGRATASTDTKAIDLVAEQQAEEDWTHGAYAVPARSFRLRVPEEKVTRRRLWS